MNVLCLFHVKAKPKAKTGEMIDLKVVLFIQDFLHGRYLFINATMDLFQVQNFFKKKHQKSPKMLCFLNFFNKLFREKI